MGNDSASLYLFQFVIRYGGFCIGLLLLMHNSSNTQSRFQHHMFHLFKKTPLTEWWQTSVRNTAMHSRSAWPCPWWKTPHIPSEHFWTSKRVKWTIDDVVDEHKKIFYPKKEIVKSALSMSGWRSACSLCLFEQRCRDRTTSFRVETGCN